MSYEDDVRNGNPICRYCNVDTEGLKTRWRNAKQINANLAKSEENLLVEKEQWQVEKQDLLDRLAQKDAVPSPEEPAAEPPHVKVDPEVWRSMVEQAKKPHTVVAADSDTAQEWSKKYDQVVAERDSLANNATFRGRNIWQFAKTCDTLLEEREVLQSRIDAHRDRADAYQASMETYKEWLAEMRRDGKREALRFMHDYQSVCEEAGALKADFNKLVESQHTMSEEEIYAKKLADEVTDKLRQVEAERDRLADQVSELQGLCGDFCRRFAEFKKPEDTDAE